MSSEFCNQNAYDCVQVHGGSGFMKDYPCERIYRDARITSIYEGTTQLQVVAAIRHVGSGSYSNIIKEYEAIEVPAELAEMKAKLVEMTTLYEKSVAMVTADKDAQYIDFHARRLVEMAGHIVMGYLLLQDTMRNDSFRRSTENYIRLGEAETNKNASFIANFKPENIECYLNK